MKTAVIFISFSIIFFSCKKGANDPFISLKSRSSRVIGKWNATSYASSWVSSFGDNENHTMSNGSYTDTNPFGIYNEGNENFSIELKKDGTWFLTEIHDSDSSSAQGTWYFTGGVGNYKNKDHIVLLLTKNSTTFWFNSAINSDITFSLDELRNNKMVWKYNLTETEANGNSSVFEDTWVWEQ